MEVRIVKTKPKLVIGMRKKGPYKEIVNMIMQLFQYAVKNRVPIQGAPGFLCRKTAEESKEADEKGTADLEVDVPVLDKTEKTEEIKCYELPGGKMARILHIGPYEECEPAYTKLFLHSSSCIRKVYI